MLIKLNSCNCFICYFEKLMQRQILGDIEAILSIYLCDYGKRLTKQQTFLDLTEDWKKMLDKNCFRGAVLIYLSKK